MRNQPRLPFDYEAREEPRVTAWGGLPLVAEAASAMGLLEAIAREVRIFGDERQFDEVSNSIALLLTLAAGGECLDDIGVLKQDNALSALLSRELPSPDTVRQFLYRFHSGEAVEAARKDAESRGRKGFIPAETPALRGLARAAQVLVEQAHRRAPQSALTLDVDATVIESHKKEAMWTFKKVPGYQPLIAYCAELKLVVADEFRDGNVLAYVATTPFIARALDALPAGPKQRLRADAGFYGLDVLRLLMSRGVEFAIGCEVGVLFKRACAEVPEEKWKTLQEREDDVVQVTDISFAPTRWNTAEWGRLRCVAIRTTSKQAQLDLAEDAPSVTFHGVVSNRFDMEPGALAEWYWEKGGTVELAHDVIKNEIGGGTLPCGRFGANAAWFRYVTMTFNLLQVLRASGPRRLENARPKRLRLNLLAIAATLATHARRLIARVYAAAGDSIMEVRRAIWRPPPGADAMA